MHLYPQSTEPFTSNMYNRRVLAGEFTIVNKYLLKDLVDKGIWTERVRNQIIADRGSVQNVAEIPADMKELYKTVWEIKQKVIIDQAADRGAYICQSQSLNIHMGEPTTAKMTSMHFYAWKRGLKTGMYYLRSRPKADAIQFTVDQSTLAAKKPTATSSSISSSSSSHVSASYSSSSTSSSHSSKGKIASMAGATDENSRGNHATQGLDYQAEPACENCSA